MDLQTGMCFLCNDEKIIPSSEAQKAHEVIGTLFSKKIFNVSELNNIQPSLELCPVCYHKCIILKRLPNVERNLHDMEVKCFLCKNEDTLFKIVDWQYFKEVSVDLKKKDDTCIMCSSCLFYLHIRNEIKTKLLLKYPKLKTNFLNGDKRDKYEKNSSNMTHTKSSDTTIADRDEPTNNKGLNVTKKSAEDTNISSTSRGKLLRNMNLSSIKKMKPLKHNKSLKANKIIRNDLKFSNQIPYVLVKVLNVYCNNGNSNTKDKMVIPKSEESDIKRRKRNRYSRQLNSVTENDPKKCFTKNLVIRLSRMKVCDYANTTTERENVQGTNSSKSPDVLCETSKVKTKRVSFAEDKNVEIESEIKENDNQESVTEESTHSLSRELKANLEINVESQKENDVVIAESITDDFKQTESQKQEESTIESDTFSLVCMSDEKFQSTENGSRIQKECDSESAESKNSNTESNEMSHQNRKSGESRQFSDEESILFNDTESLSNPTDKQSTETNEDSKNGNDSSALDISIEIERNIENNMKETVNDTSDTSFKDQVLDTENNTMNTDIVNSNKDVSKSTVFQTEAQNSSNIEIDKEAENKLDSSSSENCEHASNNVDSKGMGETIFNKDDSSDPVNAAENDTCNEILKIDSLSLTASENEENSEDNRDGDMKIVRDENISKDGIEEECNHVNVTCFTENKDSNENMHEINEQSNETCKIIDDGTDSNSFSPSEKTENMEITEEDQTNIDLILSGSILPQEQEDNTFFSKTDHIDANGEKSIQDATINCGNKRKINEEVNSNLDKKKKKVTFCDNV